MSQSGITYIPSNLIGKIRGLCFDRAFFHFDGRQ